MRRAEAEHRTVSQVVQTALRAYADGRYDAIEPRAPRGCRPIDPQPSDTPSARLVRIGCDREHLETVASI
jgi:hypothetical protein